MSDTPSVTRWELGSFDGWTVSATRAHDEPHRTYLVAARGSVTLRCVALQACGKYRMARWYQGNFPANEPALSKAVEDALNRA